MDQFTSDLDSFQGEYGCPTCKDLRLIITNRAHTWISLEGNIARTAAKGCRYCALVAQALRSYTKQDLDFCSGELNASIEQNGLLHLQFHSKQQESLETFTCEVFTTPDETPDFPDIPSGFFHQSHLGSERYLENIIGWAARCAHKHTRCNREDEQFIPTRILDVGHLGDKYVKLTETKGSSGLGSYISLSHSWGNTKPITTTKNTIAQHLSGILLSVLPPAFRDAAIITRALGVRFLWIDSLCIVQDDHNDWVSEAAQMDKVYGNCFLTICATAIENANQPVLRPVLDFASPINIPDPWVSDKLTNVYVRNAISHGQIDYLTASPPPKEHLTSSALPHELKANAVDYPLLERAWPYQEHLLSPRIVHFTRDEVIWQCNEASHCCCSPWPWAPVDPEWDVLQSTKSSVAAALALTDRRRIYHCWEQTIRRYSGKRITREEDRLPALSGIAKRFIKAHKSNYLAGLWADHLFEGLCWERKGARGSRPKKYLAPSWSWCSVFGQVTWPIAILSN